MADKEILEEATNTMRQLVDSNRLEEANWALNRMLRSAEFKNYIYDDARNPNDPFLKSFLANFKFVICPDSESLVEEGDSTCKYNKSRFLICVENFDDLVFQFGHVYMHDYCRPQWLRVREPKSELNPVELDQIEEIFGTYVLAHDFKTLLKRFPTSFPKLAIYFGMPFDTDFEQNLITYQLDTELEFVALNKIRKWLGAQNNIHHAIVFPIFIKSCFLIKGTDEFRKYLNFKYRSVNEQRRIYEIDVGL